MNKTAVPEAAKPEPNHDSGAMSVNERNDMTASDHVHDRVYRRLPEDIKNILRQEAKFSGAKIPGEDLDQVDNGKSPKSEDTGSSRSRGWFRLGFALSVFCACLLALVYRHGPVISEHIPALEAGIASYSEIVEQVRREIEATFFWLPGFIDRLTRAFQGIAR